MVFVVMLMVAEGGGLCYKVIEDSNYYRVVYTLRKTEPYLIIFIFTNTMMTMIKSVQNN